MGAALRRVLAREHEVRVVTSGAEALELLKAGAAFDLILCDVMMPAMSGVALHAELARCRPALARRIVFLTGGAFTAEVRAFLDTSPNERWEKPIDAHKLRAGVARLLAAFAGER